MYITLKTKPLKIIKYIKVMKEQNQLCLRDLKFLWIRLWLESRPIIMFDNSIRFGNIILFIDK